MVQAIAASDNDKVTIVGRSGSPVTGIRVVGKGIKGGSTDSGGG